jgi:hypothetical protein
MSFLIRGYNGRAREWSFTLFEDDDTTELSLAEDDVVRVKIGTNGQAPSIEASSIDPDQVTFTPDSGDCSLALTAAQVTLLGVGAHDMEVDVFDESEDKLKHASYGVLFVHPSQLGETGGEDSSSSGGSSVSAESSESSESSSS